MSATGEPFALHHTDSVYWRHYRRHHAHALRLTGRQAVAEAVGSAEARAVAAGAWAQMAFNEYRAAATMSEVARAMTEAQAPLDLSWSVAQFPGQELMHAHLCAELAAACGQDAAGPGPAQPLAGPKLPVRTSGLRERADALVVTHLCVAETLSLALLRAAKARAGGKFFAPVVDLLCRDEARHSTIGWTYLAWAQTTWSGPQRALLSQAATLAVAGYRQMWRAAAEDQVDDEARFALCLMTPAVQQEAGEQAVEQGVRAGLMAYGLELH